MSRVIQKSSLSLVILISLSCFSFAQNTPPILAVISDVSGDVILKKAKKSREVKAVFGMQLIQGDQLKTLSEARASMLFSNGDLIHVGPNSSITISDQEKGGQITQISQDLVASFSDLAMRQDKDGEMGVIMKLRSDDYSEHIMPLSPCNTRIASNRPGISWATETPADEFVIRLYNSEGLMWEKKTTDTHLDFPDDETGLEFGVSYFWNVEGQDLINSFRSLNQKFTILSEESIKELNEEKQKLLELFDENPNSSSLHSLLGSLYAKKGLYEEAIHEFEIVRDSNPEATLPHEILGGLYNDVGKKDLAIIELKQALTLEKDK